MASSLTGAAYLTGLAYHQYYMRELRFNHELFPKETADYFVFAALATLEACPTWLQALNTQWLLMLAIASSALLMGIFHYAGKRLDESAWGKRHRKRMVANTNVQAIGSVLAWPMTVGLVLVYVPAFLTFILLAPIALGESMAKKAADRDAKSFAANCANAPKRYFCTSIHQGEEVIAQGFIVDVSEKYLAIVVDGVSRSMPLDGKSFSSHDVTALQQ